MKENNNLLPRDFDIKEYERMVNITGLSYWAFQFAQRAYGLPHFSKELTSKTGGVVNPMREIWLTMWNNGVFYSKYPEEIAAYMDRFLAHILNKYGATKVEEEDIQTDIDMIRDALGVRKVNDHCFVTQNGETFKFNFPNEESAAEYRKKEKKIKTQTAAFLINLKMPTHRIVKELEEQIIFLKEKRKVREYEKMGKSRPYEWSQSLAVWDLWKKGVKPRVIQNKVLAVWHDDYKSPLALTIGDRVLEKMFERRKKTAEKMISHGWKRLSGNP